MSDRTCVHCGAPTPPTKPSRAERKFCGAECYNAHRTGRHAERSGFRSGQFCRIGFGNCAWCDKLFTLRDKMIGTAARGQKVTCSPWCKRQWSNARSRANWPDQYQRNKATHFASAYAYKARRNNAPVVERVELLVVAERDKWTCHLCRKKVDPDAVERRHRPSIDHLLPLSLGGEHSYRNVALAHVGCNNGKRERPANDQLRLIG